MRFRGKTTSFAYALGLLFLLAGADAAAGPPAEDVISLDLGQAERARLNSVSKTCADQHSPTCYVGVVTPMAAGTKSAYVAAWGNVQKGKERDAVNSRCSSAGQSTYLRLKCYSETLGVVAEDARTVIAARASGKTGAEVLGMLKDNDHLFAGPIEAACGSAPADACFDSTIAGLSKRFSGAAAKMQQAKGSFMGWSYLTLRCDRMPGTAGACTQARNWGDELLVPLDGIAFTGAATGTPAVAANEPAPPANPASPAGGPSPGPSPAPVAGSGTGQSGTGASPGGTGWSFDPTGGRGDCPPGSGGRAGQAIADLFAHRIPYSVLAGGAPSAPPGPRATRPRNPDPTGMRAMLDAHDQSIGLGRGGGALSAIRDSMLTAEAPQEGTADFVVEIDQNGKAVGVKLGAHTAAPEWNAMLPNVRAALAQKSFRINPGARGLTVTVHVESNYRLPSGARSRAQIRQDGAGASVAFDLSDIGASPTRHISARLVEESPIY